MDLNRIIAEVKADDEEIANYSRAEAKTMYQIKYKELQTLAGKHGIDHWLRKVGISEVNQNISQHQAETGGS